MTTVVSAGAALEPQSGAVGRSTTVLVDAARGDRALALDCWYPARRDDQPRSVYELLPGIGFTASALDGAAALPGPHPLVVWSHGRTGTRSSYAMLCEGLAARGYVVVAPDHPGDTLADWLLGAAVDDATNERQRVDDVRFVVDALTGDLADSAPLDPVFEVDAGRIAVAGHSYGAFTAFALAGAEPTDARIAAVAGLQSFTRTLPRRVLARVGVPALMLVGTHDSTTPPETDADRAFDALGSRDALRIDVEAAGHQACSDVGLYLELAPQIDGLPELVSDYVRSLDGQVTGHAGDPWRPTLELHLRVLGAWLDHVFDRDRDRARLALDEIRATPGITTRVRSVE